MPPKSYGYETEYSLTPRIFTEVSDEAAVRKFVGITHALKVIYAIEPEGPRTIWEAHPKGPTP